MKKLVFVSLMMADRMEKKHFPVDGNVLIEYPGEVYYAINAVLAKTLKADDEVKVLLLETKAGEEAGCKNAKLFEDELNEINASEKIGAKIEYETISSVFITSKYKYNSLFMKLINNFKGEEELYADITFGPKSLPMVIFSALQFGEKFYDCSIGNIIYLKTEFVKTEDGRQKIKEGSQLICDYTPLYQLNSFITTMQSSSGEKAKKAFEILFKK